jgi:hypothetical protein
MGDELCSPAEMKNTGFFSDILLKAEIHLWYAIATVHAENVIENISLYHSWESAPPPHENLALARLLTPNLSNALRLRARLTQVEAYLVTFMSHSTRSKGR